MKVSSIEIKEAQSWESDPGQLKGYAMIEVGQTQLKVNLSRSAILAVLETVKEEVVREAEQSAKQVKNAFKESINGPLALGGTDDVSSRV